MNAPHRRPRAVAVALPADPRPLAAVLGLLAALAALSGAAAAALLGALWR